MCSMIITITIMNYIISVNHHRNQPSTTIISPVVLKIRDVGFTVFDPRALWGDALVVQALGSSLGPFSQALSAPTWEPTEPNTL